MATCCTGYTSPCACPCHGALERELKELQTMTAIETDATLRGATYADGVHLLAFGPATDTGAELWSIPADLATDPAQSEPDRLLVTILDPEQRHERQYSFTDETDFRDTVRQYLRGVAELEDWPSRSMRLWLIWNPGQTNAEGEAL